MQRDCLSTLVPQTDWLLFNGHLSTLAVLRFLLGSTFLCPPYTPLAQTLVLPPLDLCGTLGNAATQHGKHGCCLLSTNRALSGASCLRHKLPSFSSSLLTTLPEKGVSPPGTEQALNE